MKGKNSHLFLLSMDLRFAFTISVIVLTWIIWTTILFHTTRYRRPLLELQIRAKGLVSKIYFNFEFGLKSTACKMWSWQEEQNRTEVTSQFYILPGYCHYLTFLVAPWKTSKIVFIYPIQKSSSTTQGYPWEHSPKVCAVNFKTLSKTVENEIATEITKRSQGKARECDVLETLKSYDLSQNLKLYMMSYVPERHQRCQAISFGWSRGSVTAGES